MKTFDETNFKMIIHENNIREVIVKENCVLTGQDILNAYESAKTFKPNTIFYVLLHGEENSNIASDARRAAATDDYAKNNAALAIFTTKSVHLLAGNLFLKVNHPKVPTKFFGKKEEAIIWLESLINNSN